MRSKLKKWCHIWIPWPKKPIVRYTSCKVSEFKILTSNQRSSGDLDEVKMKNDVNFGFLDLKNLYFNIQHAKLGISKMLTPDLRSEVIWWALWGQNEKNVIFGFLGPKNLYFDIHHAKLVNSKFWPLNRGQRSHDDLYEIKMIK